MPELPEVESVRRGLAAWLPGRVVAGMWRSPLRLRREIDLRQAQACLLGLPFGVPERFGKILLLPASQGGARLRLHLGMSGRVHTCPESEPLASHTHFRLRFSDGHELRYIDARRFGFVDFLAPGTPDLLGAALGLDPLDPGFAEGLLTLCAGKGRPIKVLLMAQEAVAGLGNIYATEALWRAGVSPWRSASSLDPREVITLAREIQGVLSEALRWCGTTLRDYRQADGQVGGYFSELQVYGRHGEPCRRCSAALEKAPVGGRTTTWCGQCQR